MNKIPDLDNVISKLDNESVRDEEDGYLSPREFRLYRSEVEGKRKKEQKSSKHKTHED